MRLAIAFVMMLDTLIVGMSGSQVYAVDHLAFNSVPSARNVEDTDQTGPSKVHIVSGNVRIDVANIKTPAWKEAIRKATEYPALRAGGQVTLVRVVCEDGQTNLATPRSDERPVVVNGIQLYLPGLIDRVELAMFFESPTFQSPAVENKIQLQSIKLVRFEDFPNGGGMYQEVLPGEFVLIEHINSTRRESGRDPLAVGSFTFGHAKLGIPVPPRGQLGIAGDIVLSPSQPEALGRIVAEVVSDPAAPVNVEKLRVGPEMVGGRYGETFEFNPHGVCSTGLIPPGSYRILLPDFDMVKSRWEVRVKPGEVTYLRFHAHSQKEITLEHERLLSFAEND